MPDTITSFTTFVAATKALASEVNTNFSNFRGNLLPINADSASASHITHNLGSEEHRWHFLFSEGVNFRGNSQGSNWTVEGDTTTKSLLFSTGDGTTRFVLNAVRSNITQTGAINISTLGSAGITGIGGVDTTARGRQFRISLVPISGTTGQSVFRYQSTETVFNDNRSVILGCFRDDTISVGNMRILSFTGSTAGDQVIQDLPLSQFTFIDHNYTAETTTVNYSLKITINTSTCKASVANAIMIVEEMI